MRLFLLLLAIALLTPGGLAQTCANPEVINVEMVETSTGPYSAGDTFEVTLNMSSTSGSVETMETSTMVVDFNDAALDYADTPVSGTDFEWLLFQGFGNTSEGGLRNYTSTVTITSESRITPFVNLDFTSDTFGQEIPDTPTAALVLRWTVVDPTAGLTVVPRSEQFFQGPRPPLGGGIPTPCLSPGTFTGVESGQQTVTGTKGWRLLGAPAAGLTADGLAAINLVQGVPGHTPAAGANLLVGYDGTAFGAPEAADDEIAPGTGFYWHFYEAEDFESTPPPEFQPLPLVLAHSGAPVVNLASGGGFLPDQIALPLHSAGDGWNLLANPFATGLDVTQLQPGGGAFASEIVQVWDGGADDSGTFLLSTGPDLMGTVAGWQGFFLENATATDATVPSTARATASTFASLTVSQTVAAKSADRHVIPFVLEGVSADGSKLIDRAISLVVDPAASPDWDLQDASKLTPASGAYATLAFDGMRNGESRMKAQEARPLADGGFTVPLLLNVVGGDAALTLYWSQEALPQDVTATLLDVETGVSVDLHATREYSFRAAATQAARGSAGDAFPTASLKSDTAARRFLLAFGQAVVAGENTAAPLALELSAPAPNPFRTEATLGYALPTSGHVRLQVFDLLGRRVAEVVDREQTAGRHAATFRSDGLAAGLYVIRLEVEGQVRTQRVTVVR